MTDINSAPSLVGTHTPAAHRNRVLGRHSWTVLRDLRRPDDLGGRIDRIFVGPGGIVVVESARWLGEVAVERGALRLDGAVKDDAVEHAGMTAAHISALLPADLRTSVRAVVSLAYQGLAPTAVGPADVIGEAGLEKWVLGLPTRLDAQRALALLAPRERACVVLRFYEDMTVPQIASELSLSLGSVKRYLHDAVARLEQHLGPLADAHLDDLDDAAHGGAR